MHSNRVPSSGVDVSGVSRIGRLCSLHTFLGLRFRYIFRGAPSQLSCDRKPAERFGCVADSMRLAEMRDVADFLTATSSTISVYIIINCLHPLLRSSLFEESGVVRYHRTMEASWFPSSMVGGIKAAYYSRAHVLPSDVLSYDLYIRGLTTRTSP